MVSFHPVAAAPKDRIVHIRWQRMFSQALRIVPLIAVLMPSFAMAERVVTGQQALYTFDEGNGTVIMTSAE
jgi:hypothetical protein